MKTIRIMPLLTVAMLAILLTSCGPSYVGVRTAPTPSPYYGYGPGYYGPRPYYGYAPRYYRRPPVIVQRRTYVVPRGGYYNSRPSNPNARSNNGGYRNYGPRYNGNGGSRGPR